MIIFKKNSLILLLFSIILFSCNGGMISFYVEDSTETTITSSIPFNLPFNIPVGSISSTSSNEYENNNTTPDLIKEVSLENLTITITNPVDEDFSFLESIHITIKKADDSEPKEIAFLDNINSSAQSISLTTTEENLIPYLQDETYKLDTKVVIREYPGHDVDIKINLKFKVTAKLL